MASLKPYSIQTDRGPVHVKPSNKKDVNWTLQLSVGNYHLPTKKAVKKHLKKLGYKILN